MSKKTSSVLTPDTKKKIKDMVHQFFLKDTREPDLFRVHIMHQKDKQFVLLRLTSVARLAIAFHEVVSETFKATPNVKIPNEKSTKSMVFTNKDPIFQLPTDDISCNGYSRDNFDKMYKDKKLNTFSFIGHVFVAVEIVELDTTSLTDQQKNFIECTALLLEAPKIIKCQEKVIFSKDITFDTKTNEAASYNWDGDDSDGGDDDSDEDASRFTRTVSMYERRYI